MHVANMSDILTFLIFTKRREDTRIFVQFYELGCIPTRTKISLYVMHTAKMIKHHRDVSQISESVAHGSCMLSWYVL